MKFVIVGAGDVGTSLSVNLASHQHEVILVEQKEAKVNKELAALDLQVVIGNGAAPETLVQAGIEDADYLIAVTNVDETNIAACFISRLLNPKPKRIARIRDLNLAHQHIAPELINEYFDLIINPEQAAADYLLRLFRIPGAREIVEFEGGKIRVLGLAVSPQSALLNMRLDALKNFQDEMPLLIAAVMRGTRLIVPRGDDHIRVGDVIYAVTIPEKTKLLFELAGKPWHQSRSAMIWGATVLARSLARALEQQGMRLKLIVGQQSSAAQLAADFASALVLQGDGTDQNLLLQENIDQTDAFIAATADDENNVLAALLAKKLGAKTTIALVNKSGYLPIVSAIGVDVVISSRAAAATAIFRHIHSRSIVSESALQQEGAGFIEIDAREGNPLLDKPLKDLKLPHGILIAAIINQKQITIPTGEAVIRAGDRVVIFLTKAALKKMEKLLNLKLELFA